MEQESIKQHPDDFIIVNRNVPPVEMSFELDKVSPVLVQVLTGEPRCSDACSEHHTFQPGCQQYIPQREEEHRVAFEVEVETYGRKDDDWKTVQGAARALYLVFGNAMHVWFDGHDWVYGRTKPEGEDFWAVDCGDADCAMHGSLHDQDVVEDEMEPINGGMEFDVR